MANKLRDLFDDSKQEVSGKVDFDSTESYKDFVNAVNKAIKEGIPSSVKGIANITLILNDGKSKYPIGESGPLTEVRVLPDASPIEMDVRTDKGNRKLKFLRQNLGDGYLLQNMDGKGAIIKILFDMNVQKIHLNYNANYAGANSIEEMIDYYNTIYYFLRTLFKNGIDDEAINNVMNYFIASIAFFDEINKISNELGVKISPVNLKEIDNDELFIEKLYFLLVEKKVIRINQKVNNMKNVKFFSDKRPENNPMTVTYLEEADLIFNGTEKKMYFVNMAFNLIIDKENIEENGDNKIYFRDNHENPMYISRRMFLNVNDAEKER